MAALEKKLQSDFHQAHNKMLKNYLAGLLPRNYYSLSLDCPALTGRSRLAPWLRLNARPWRALKEFTLEVKELKGFSKAMITAGGVDVKEVDTRTMRSRLYENLFLAGEILDLDGPTGGYNLQICWSTGYTAGDSVIF